MKQLFLLLTTAGLVGGGFFFRSQTQVQPLALPVTRLTVTGEGEVTTGIAKGRNRFRLAFEALLERNALVRADGTVRVVCRFLGPSYRLEVDGVPQEDLARQVASDLAAQIAAEYQSDGRLVRIEADRPLSAAAQGIVSVFFQGTQTAFSSDRSIRQETDPGLSPEATISTLYQRDGRKTTRRRQSATMGEKWGLAAEEQMSIAFADYGELWCAADTGIAAEGVMTLGSQTFRGRGMIASARTRLTLKPEDRNSPTIADFTGSEDLLGGDRFARAERDLHRKTLGADTFESLATQTGHESPPGLARKWRSLMALFPGEEERFRTLMGRQHGRGLGVMAEALRDWGTPTAQEMLWTRFASGGPDDRALLMATAAGTETPTEETVNRLWRLASQENDDGYGATVALGIAARQLSDDDERRATAIAEVLLDRLRDPNSSTTAKQATLIGLGNSAYPRAAGVISSATKDSDTRIADAAIRALARIGGTGSKHR